MATLLALEVPVVLTQTAVLGLFKAYPGGVIVNEETNAIITPLMPEWGAMMELPFRLLRAGNWWDWAPLIALSIAILSFNLLGEGLRRRWATRIGWR